MKLSIFNVNWCDSNIFASGKVQVCAKELIYFLFSCDRLYKSKASDYNLAKCILGFVILMRSHFFACIDSSTKRWSPFYSLVWCFEGNVLNNLNKQFQPLHMNFFFFFNFLRNLLNSKNLLVWGSVTFVSWQGRSLIHKLGSIIWLCKS